MLSRAIVSGTQGAVARQEPTKHAHAKHTIYTTVFFIPSKQTGYAVISVPLCSGSAPGSVVSQMAKMAF